MDPTYERETLDAEDDHWWYRGRRRIINRILGSLPLPHPARVIDAGCGGGRMMVELSRLGEVTGVEPSTVALERARARSVGPVVEGTLEALPFGDSEFHLATCLDVIEHVDDDRGALAELRRVVRPGGWLVVSVPAYPSFWSSHDELNHHRRRYTRRALLSAAEGAGWAPVRTTHFNVLLLPAAAAYRYLERLRPRGTSPNSEFAVLPDRLNMLLEQPLRLEADIVASGRRLPVGLSLVAVFRAPE